uniref:Uncharacterized protein n=2 Tax=Setaria italica TaxID=4555 RepID=K3ZPS2_SETIT
MRLSQELPRSRPKKKLQKAAARTINLAQNHRASQNPTQGVPRCHLQRMRMTAEARKMRKRKTMKTHCVVHVVTTTVRMSSGYAVMPARHGSMASVSRSLLPRPSTSSTTSARTAAVVAREPEHDPGGYIRCSCLKNQNLTRCTVKHLHGGMVLNAP